MDIATALAISSRGMQAQTERLRVIAQNLANANTTGSTPGADPYRRRLTVFDTVLDRATGVEDVAVKRIVPDSTPFAEKYDPGNPAADARGYVRQPNVNSLVELMDMREAERSFAANLTVMQSSRAMLTRVIELLR